MNRRGMQSNTKAVAASIPNVMSKQNQGTFYIIYIVQFCFNNKVRHFVPSLELVVIPLQSDSGKVSVPEMRLASKCFLLRVEGLLETTSLPQRGRDFVLMSFSSILFEFQPMTKILRLYASFAAIATFAADR
ncbi:hypothetical protein MTR67_030214 [Solanum verrucosum]|uniref:Uncharacterized protein n=1 Tax=Solanum verrucosum TaxID=315347 RepID=A0AAF0RDS2_SOLVR|nr:hypothetical protein MTR67_030214 [Solanum verrucosum]